MERRSESITNIAVALSAAQKEMRAAHRDSENPYHETRYTSLASAWEAARLALANNDLALAQMPSALGPVVTISTLLMHKSGEWLASDLALTSASQTPQAMGAAITYGRRYSMMAILGIASEDDDAEAAEGRKKGESKTAAKAEQEAVRDRKLRQARDTGMSKAVPPPLPPEGSLGVGPHDISLEDRLQASVKQADAKKPFKEMMTSFAHLKEECLGIGRLQIYYDGLEAYHVKHANEFRDFETARNCYKLIAQMINDAKGMLPASPEQEAAEERQAMRGQ